MNLTARELAILSWASLFALTWLMLGRAVLTDWLSAAGWSFFLVVAIMASAAASPRRKA